MFSQCCSWSKSHSVLMQACIVAFLVCTISNIPSVDAQPKAQARSGGEARPPDFLYRVSRTAREMLVYVLGEETLKLVTEIASKCVWVFCTGVSNGLIAISGLLQQLLDVMGLDGKQISSILAFSPEQVQHILLWATLALLGYWMLSLVLGLFLSLLGRLLWGLKISLFLVAFFYLVTGVSDPHLLATSLLGLVGVYALLGWVSSRGRGDVKLEAKVKNLEKQVEALRTRQRHALRNDDY
ncbi:voltage-gated monoatomic cation channel TMEM109 [Ambystoma mexicanum]|uniref:voltage-gated monoatomic cation channel TMEM109 n=1 Tax=Ambystoma mexicanum TaxID=8296 RepID=UPI0037E75A0C